MNIPKDEIDMYKARLTTTFASLKQINNYDEWMQKSIPIENGLGKLRCICELHANDDDIIGMLALWRDQATTFRDGFKVTFEGTKRWLRDRLLDVPDRILFLVMDSQDHPVGHMGFDRSLNDDCILNFDNLIRGVRRAPPEIMTEAAKAMFAWATDAIRPRSIMSTPVMGHNINSIRFHKFIGFKLVDKKAREKKDPAAEDEYDLTFTYDPDSPQNL